MRYAVDAQLLRQVSDACSGTAGVLAGVATAVARDANPYISGFASGARCFTLGYSYWCTSLPSDSNGIGTSAHCVRQVARTMAMRSWGGEERMRPVDKITASAMAGSAAGAVAGLMRTFPPSCCR